MKRREVLRREWLEPSRRNTMNHATDLLEIQQLLYRYCYHLDRGDLQQMAMLFAEARLITPGGGTVENDPAAIVALYQEYTRIYDDNGTPKTRHIVANTINDLDEDRHSSSSNYPILLCTAHRTIPYRPFNH